MKGVGSTSGDGLLVSEGGGCGISVFGSFSAEFIVTCLLLDAIFDGLKWCRKERFDCTKFGFAGCVIWFGSGKEGAGNVAIAEAGFVRGPRI